MFSGLKVLQIQEKATESNNDAFPPHCLKITGPTERTGTPWPSPQLTFGLRSWYNFPQTFIYGSYQRLSDCDFFFGDYFFY